MTQRLKIIALICVGIAAAISIAVVSWRPGQPYQPSDVRASKTPNEPVGPPPAQIHANEASVGGSEKLRPIPQATDTSSRWYTALHDTGRLAINVKAAAAAAESGDSSAAWELANLMFRCANAARAIRDGKTKEHFMQVTLVPGYPPAEALIRGQTFDRCAEFLSDPELRPWEMGRGGKLTAKHWRELALNLGSPPARAEQLVRDAFSISEAPPDRARQLRTQVRENVAEVIRSRDLEAWYKLGMAMSDGHFARDPSYGWALALSACRMGFDCSVTRERNEGYGCALNGSCSPDTTLDDRLQGISRSVYTKAYARSQDLVSLLERGDWAEAEKYIPLDGALFEN